MSLSQYNRWSVQVLSRLGLAFLLFIGTDTAIFRSGFYARYLQPDSSADMMQLTLLRERKHQTEWHYMLRELDPTARRYSAIAFTVDDYDDEDTYVDFTDYPGNGI